MTLTVNFIITAIAFVAIFVLFFAAQGWSPGGSIQLKGLLTNLPYGWLGVIAAFQFAIWYYLGIEGTCQAAEEVRSVARSLPLGTMTGMMTLLIAATMTWYCTAGLVPWEYLGVSFIPQYDAARAFGNPFVSVVMFIGTLFSAVASANGTINDAARAWFSMGRDRYLPKWFGAVHPKYRTPYRSILFLVPVAISFGFTGLLDQVITFSILSGLLGYTFMPINMFKFRRQWPLGSIRRGYVHPFHPFPAITLFVLCCITYFATYLGYGVQLLAMMTFYIAASIWFHFFRYKYVRRGDQFQMNWPRPMGY
jgi:ethanolamine permease